MKLQHLSVIFIIIMIPIILVFSYYMKLQKEALEVRSEYDQKLTMAVKEAVRAYEINTTEFNYYDEREDWDSNETKVNQRDAIYASVNAFTTSIANFLGMSGASKESILNYIPAMVFNMYEGFYIYGPVYVPKIAEDANEMAQGITESPTNEGEAEGILLYEKEGGGTTGKISEAEKNCEYTLTPITPYSAKYITADGNTEIIVEYTLDNYIKVKGKIEGTYYEKEGYLTYFGDEEEESAVSSNLIGINSIQYLGKDIKPEILEETICYINNEGNVETKSHKYVYNQNQKKCYYDEEGNYFFYIDSNNQKKVLQGKNYKAILAYNGVTSYEYYMSLTDQGEKEPSIGQIWKDTYSDTFYDLGEIDDTTGEIIEGTKFDGVPDKPEGETDGYWDSHAPDNILDTPMSQIELEALLGKENTAVYVDFSAINYYIKAKEFSDWVKENLADKEFNCLELVYDEESDEYKYETKEVGKLFEVKRSNNPDNINSLIVKHKNEIIVNSINLAINETIANYNANTTSEKRKIPKIKYEDMNQTSNNISFFAFLIDLPMGYKTYNDYSFAISTNNNDYINGKTFRYLDETNTNGDEYNHYIFCDKSTAENLTAYREHEFLEKSKSFSNENYKYYLHETSSILDCYYCIVNRGKITINEDSDKYLEAYLEAVARERYRQNYTPPLYGTMPKGALRKPEETGESSEETTSTPISGGSNYEESIYGGEYDRTYNGHEY